MAPQRRTGALAGKRGGKTECGAVKGIVHTENQIGFQPNGIDPYVGVIVAPTFDMLRRLSLKKFLAYAAPFKPTLNKTHLELEWRNGSIVYCISADRPERLEGLKANWIWLDEVFQMEEQIFLECIARTSDTLGKIWVTGSLGVQYINPKLHWVYKHFKDRPIADSAAFEWSTADNPYFPQQELEDLKHSLDPVTYSQLFEIDWDTQSTGTVYGNLGPLNFVRGYKYNPTLETSFCVDWGWTHPMSAGYFQYDPKIDTVYCFDEIFGSHITLEMLWVEMQKRHYRIDNYFCDIAGNQEREQTGKSNIAWFKQAPRNIPFKYKRMGVAASIAIVRSFVCNAVGQRRLFIDEVACPKTKAGMKAYRYEQKSGIITETPLEKEDDAPDMVRYYLMNRHDFTRVRGSIEQTDRWDLFGG